jgi:hypothetical protein
MSNSNSSPTRLPLRNLPSNTTFYNQANFISNPNSVKMIQKIMPALSRLPASTQMSTSNYSPTRLPLRNLQSNPKINHQANFIPKPIQSKMITKMVPASSNPLPKTQMSISNSSSTRLPLRDLPSKIGVNRQPNLISKPMLNKMMPKFVPTILGQLPNYRMSTSNSSSTRLPSNEVPSTIEINKQSNVISKPILNEIIPKMPSSQMSSSIPSSTNVDPKAELISKAELEPKSEIEPKTEIEPKSELEPKTEIKTEIKEEPFDDSWPEISPFLNEIEIGSILRKGINWKSLPTEKQEKLKTIMNNEKPFPPPCGCIQMGQSKFFSLKHF